MKKTEQEKYDPEDIESLMMHKTFSDLYPEERAFVLKHLDSELEYESMRNTLISVQSRDKSDRISPPPSMKKDLLAMMDNEKKKGFVVWLNGFLPFVSDGSRIPAFAMGGLSLAAVIIAVLFFFPSKEEDRFADLEDKFKKENIEEKSSQESIEKTKQFDENELEKKNTNTELSESSADLDLNDLSKNEHNSNQLNAKDHLAESKINENLVSGEGNDKVQDEYFAENESDLTLNKDQGVLETELHAAEEESFEGQIADASLPAVNKKEKEESVAPSSLANVENRDLDSEFYFDNQIGNAMTIPSEQLSEITVASEKKVAVDFDEEISQEGALFEGSSGLSLTAKANESLTLIDALYTAY